MIYMIKKKHTKDEARDKDTTCITPQSFGAVADWKGKQVTGEAYYVEKAVEMGAVAVDGGIVAQEVEAVMAEAVDPEPEPAPQQRRSRRR